LVAFVAVEHDNAAGFQAFKTMTFQEAEAGTDRGATPPRGYRQFSLLMTTTSFGASYVSVFAITCFAVWAVIHVMNLTDYRVGIDDANIFFVYARHISHGYGFVYNIGGEHVEGFTSLLWVLVCAVVFRFTHHAENVLLVLSIGIVSLATTFCIRSWPIRARLGSGRSSLPWSAGFLILLLSDWRYTAWNTVTLMDNALWSSCLTFGAILAVDTQRSQAFLKRTLTIVIVLLTLTRPEGLAWVPVILAATYLNRRGRFGHGGAFRVIVPGAIAFVLTALLLTGFRLYYFGFPFPNTFYAKVSPSISYDIWEGLKYFRDFVFSTPVELICVLATTLSFAHVFLNVGILNDPQALTLSVLASIGLLLPVLTGGDHFVGFRFYQNIYPVLLLTLVAFVRFILPRYVIRASSWRSHRFLAGTGATIAVLLSLFNVSRWTSPDLAVPFANQFEIAKSGRDLGDFARELFAAQVTLPSIGAITAGGLKYTYPGEIVDLMGLNNTLMAHNGGKRIGIKNHAAFEAVTFYQLEPAILDPIVLKSGEIGPLARPNSFDNRVLRELTIESRFLERYNLAEVRSATATGNTSLMAWYRIDFLQSLEASRQFAIVQMPLRTAP
jgi:hypothetical protein